MRGVYYSACSLCYKTIGVTKNIRLLLRDGLLFRRLLLPESTVPCVIHSVYLVKSPVPGLQRASENSEFAPSV